MTHPLLNLAHVSARKPLLAATFVMFLACGESEPMPPNADGGEDAPDGGEVDAGQDAGLCEPEACPSRQAWDEATCACAPSYDASCDLAALIDERLASVDAVDCGTLEWDSTAEEQAVAVRCVKDALAMQRPLRMIWWLPGIDSAVATAVVVDDQGNASTLSFDSDPSGGSGAGQVINELQCVELSVKEDCTPSVDDSCITCAGSGEHEVICQQAPSREWEDASQ